MRAVGNSPGAEASSGRWFEDTARILLTLENYFGSAIEIVAALLIAAEIVILFAGVISRYFLQEPLVWSDELASLLFLWLASLGAVVAFRRNEHMRMTALVGMTSSRVRTFLEAISIGATLAFLLFMIEPAYEFASEEIDVTTPALELSNAWRAAALPIGLLLMAIVAVIQLISIRNLTVVAVGLGTVILVIAILAALGPALRGLGYRRGPWRPGSPPIARWSKSLAVLVRRPCRNSRLTSLWSGPEWRGVGVPAPHRTTGRDQSGK